MLEGNTDTFVNLITARIRDFNKNNVIAWIEGKRADAKLNHYWGLWTSGAHGQLYRELNEESRKQDTKPSKNPALRKLAKEIDTNEDGEITRKELKEFRKGKGKGKGKQ